MTDELPALVALGVALLLFLLMAGQPSARPIHAGPTTAPVLYVGPH